MGDGAFTDLLEAEGHNVVRFDSTARAALTASEIDMFNAADLVIGSRAMHSGSFEVADEVTVWNTQITSPLMLMSPYAIRTNRAGWQQGNDVPDSAPTPLIAEDPSHAVFSGVSLGPDGTMINDYNIMIEAGTSTMGHPPVAGGIVIATNPAVADGNGVAIAEWPVGTTVMSDAAGEQQLAGPRYFFAGGNREMGTNFQTNAGQMDLTADGQLLFLNMINYILGSEPPVPGDFNGDGEVTAADFEILSMNLGGHLDGSVGRSDGDMNFDGKVDLRDFGQFKELFPGAFAQAQGVPEPATLGLVACVLAVLALGPLRKRGERTVVE